MQDVVFESMCKGEARTTLSFQQGSGSDSADFAVTCKQHYPTFLSCMQCVARVTALLGQKAHMLSYVMLGKVKCRMKFSFFTCGYVCSCDIASDAKGEEKTAFLARC